MDVSIPYRYKQNDVFGTRDIVYQNGSQSPIGTNKTLPFVISPSGIFIVSIPYRYKQNQGGKKGVFFPKLSQSPIGTNKTVRTWLVRNQFWSKSQSPIGTNKTWTT